jgi:septum formation protein
MATSAGARGGGRPALVLASSSPQRRAILERLGLDFEVRPADVTERDSGDPAQVALHNARAKARAVARAGEQELVIGCDTIVCLDDTIHGKPADERQARQTLRALSGAEHEVVSGLALLFGAEPGRERTAIARTGVNFRELSGELLDWYLATGEWRGRAGAYAIQGAGAALVRSVRGDYENVVGLPLASLLDLYPELLTR